MPADVIAVIIKPAEIQTAEERNRKENVMHRSVYWSVGSKGRKFGRQIAFPAAILMVATIAAGTANAQQQMWNVYINLYGTPPTIGVADVNWSSNGWMKHAGPFYSQGAAWKLACELHATKRYHSPDIAAGRVNC